MKFATGGIVSRLAPPRLMGEACTGSVLLSWWRPYIGLPFGTGPGQVTCWSLVRRVYADWLGTDLPEFGDIDPRDLYRVAREIQRGDDGLTWCEPSVPLPGDVVLMRSGRGGRAICHVGVLAAPGRVLHAEEATGTVLVSLDHYSIRARVAGFRRYVQR
jgi:cell wall-associated NlpC family hydrolase